MTYTPKTPIRMNCDINVFLTRHRLLHTSVPMSISHCWINTELEREKLIRNDLGYKETDEVFLPRHPVDNRT